MTTKHFELTDETVTTPYGQTLYRIRATQDIPFLRVKAGDLGGFVQSADNLSDNAWVYDNAWVFGDARVYGYAVVSGDAWVYGNAHVFDNALVSMSARVLRNAQVYGDAYVSGNAHVSGNARVYGHALVSRHSHVGGDARLSGNAWVVTDALIEHFLDILTGTIYTSREMSWTLHRTTDGHILHMGCESGTIDHHQALCDSDKWIETSGDDVVVARPEYQAVLDLCRTRIARWNKEN